MGKRKVEHPKFITDHIKRNIAYCKRKKCVIKKAMEMSMLCGQDVSVVLHDPIKSKLVIFRSTADFNMQKIDFL